MRLHLHSIPMRTNEPLMKLILEHDIRDLLLGWEKQKCPCCDEDLRFEELCEGVPIEIYCEAEGCHQIFDEPVIISQ